MAAIIDQNVLGLDVTVNHAGAMRGSQTIQRLRDHAQRLTYGECALGVHLMPQIDAMHIFHDQKIKSIELAGVIHLNDVRVGDGRGRIGLAAEPFDELLPMRAFGELCVHDLNRHGAPQTLIDGLIHGGHTTLGDIAHDAVASLNHLRGLVLTHVVSYGSFNHD